MYKKILLLLSFVFLAPNLVAGKSKRQREDGRRTRALNAKLRQNATASKTQPGSTKVSAPAAHPSPAAKIKAPSVAAPTVSVNQDSNDKRLHCTGYSNGQVLITQASSNAVIEEIPPNSRRAAITAVACHVNSSFLPSGWAAKKHSYALAWADTGGIVKVRTHNNDEYMFGYQDIIVKQLKFFSDAKTLVFASEKKSSKQPRIDIIWLAAKCTSQTIENYSDLAISPNGQYLAVSKGMTLFIFDLFTGETDSQGEVDIENQINKLAWTAGTINLTDKNGNTYYLEIYKETEKDMGRSFIARPEDGGCFATRTHAEI